MQVQRIHRSRLMLFFVVWQMGNVCPGAAQEAQKAGLRINVDDANGQSMPCRIHLHDENGKPQQATGLPFWHDHFVCSGRTSLQVKPGRYTYEIERGPEYRRHSGAVDVAPGQEAAIDVQLNRITDLRAAGWYSADLHVHRPVSEIRLLMQAEDLDFAPVITWWNAPRKDSARPDRTLFRFDVHRMYTNMAGEDEREGGALLYFGLPRPLDLTVQSREYPSPMSFVAQARDENEDVWIDIEKPFWWDVPVWLASGEMNSIGLANNHMCRSRMYESEAWGRPRDAQRLPSPRGNGSWTQEIYYHVLNSGLRIPPSAGSASGVLPNPVGYNRVYAYLGEGLDGPTAPGTSHDILTRDNWFDALRAGRCFVTNGPLLRVRADAKLPGSVLRLPDKAPLDVEFVIEIASNDAISAVEIIHNGQVIETIPCSDVTSQRLTTTVALREPGWFLVRAIADVAHTFRFASTAPWYVESLGGQGQPSIQRESARFFLDWVDERILRVRENITDIDQLRAVIEPHEKARVFWLNRLKMADL